MTRDMTSGHQIKLILSFALPMLIGNFFQQIYNMVDSSIVGRYIGKEALAAVGATGCISFLVIGFIIGISSGFGIMIARYFGSREYDQLKNCVANIIYLATVVSVVITALSVGLTRQVLIWMNTPDNIMEDSYRYIIVIFIGIGATMFYNVLANLLRAVGDSRSPLYFLIIASLLNVVLDLLLIVVFHWGVTGAGVATVFSQFVSGTLCLLYIKKKMPILHLRKQDFRFNFQMAVRLLSLGLPMALQFSITAIGTIILQSAVNSLGSDSVAAVTAANKVQNLVTMPMESLGVTMATYCGQNLGAGKMKRINEGVHKSILIALIYSAAAFTLMRLAGTYMALLFLDAGEEAVLGQVRDFLKINTLFYPFLAVLFIYRNSVQGLGYGLPAMAAGIFELFARAYVSFAYIYRIGFSAVCYASPMAWVAAVVLLVPVYYISIHRLHQKI